MSSQPDSGMAGTGSILSRSTRYTTLRLIEPHRSKTDHPFPDFCTVLHESVFPQLMLLGSVEFESTGAELLAFMVAQPELVETAIEPETVPEKYTHELIGFPA